METQEFQPPIREENRCDDAFVVQVTEHPENGPFQSPISGEVGCETISLTQLPGPTCFDPLLAGKIVVTQDDGPEVQDVPVSVPY